MGSEYNLDDKVKEMLNSGKYPIADDKLFKGFEDRFYLTEMIKDEVEYFLEGYEEFYKKLLELNDDKTILSFLREDKNWDIANNQSIEGESLKKIDDARKKIDKTAIDRLIDLKGQLLEKDVFVDIHKTLLIGTSREGSSGLRPNDNYYVGLVNDDKELVIRWFPALVKDIDRLTLDYLKYVNERDMQDDYQRVIWPILFNIVLTGLQLFKDGNTRYARLLQTIKLWENLDGVITKQMCLPILYPSVQIYPYRDQARALVGDIISNPENEKAWIDAIKFHLHRLQDANNKGYEDASSKVRRLMR